MFKKITFISLVGLLAFLTGCEIKTPEIRGVVLDAETKQPLPEAWITGMITIRSKSVMGDITHFFSVESPHTRTDKLGRFFIASRKFNKRVFLNIYGGEVKNFGIAAHTIDDRGGSIDLMRFLGKDSVEIAILVRSEHANDTERDYFAYLQGLYKYCTMGKFGVEVPGVEGGCDEWELNYVITKHETYLERYREAIQKEGYSNALDRLSELYERKGDYVKAAEAIKRNLALMERKGLFRFKDWQKTREEGELKIKRLERKQLEKRVKEGSG